MRTYSIFRTIGFISVLLIGLQSGCVPRGCQQDAHALFSVSDTKQVEFALGNLDIDGRSLVTHQWEYGGLFGWGTGNRPADTSDNWQEYTKFFDWGNSVEGRGWHTLTGMEWHYVLFERTDAASKWAKGTVNGMHGLLLLPDRWEQPSECECITGNNGWEVNCYTVEQWAQMEAAGAVFLPAAGFRWGAMPYAFDCEGLYWSSTTQDKGCPYTMHFDSDVLAVDWDNTPQFGQSVRLVRDCSLF